MTFNWNVVNHTGVAYDSIQERVYKLIRKLEKHLVHFPEDAVHLQVCLDQNAKKKRYQAGLNLRIPSNVLHTSKTHENLASAVEAAVEALVRQLKRLKARIRHERQWEHKPEVKAKTFRAPPVIGDEGPQGLSDLIRDMLCRDYQRVLDFVQRQLDTFAMNGVIPRHALDARDIVDRAAEEVLRHPRLKPLMISMENWFLGLAFHKTRSQLRTYLAERNQRIPLDLEVRRDESHQPADHRDTDASFMDAIWGTIDPPEFSEQDFVADPSQPHPARMTDRHIVQEAVRDVIRKWPVQQRTVFEMYFVEGLGPEEIALLLNWKAEQVTKAIEAVQVRLRDLFALGAASGEADLSEDDLAEIGTRLGAYSEEPRVRA